MFNRIILISASLFVGLCSYGQISQIESDTKNITQFPPSIEKNYDDLLLQMTQREISNTSNCYSSSDQLLNTHDSVFTNRLYSLPSKMELSYNPLVRKYIEMYLKKPGLISSLLSKGQYYFSMFEQELDKEDLPLELKYLPVIESALNPKARSRVGATGLWQFMLATGRMYNLEVNSLVDERSDPEKSTVAAVRYLKALYEIYGDWNLVIAAYNCGPGNVNKAMRRSGGLTDYWAIYPFLPRETRGYVPIFVAATYVMSYYDKHGICPGDPEIPVLMDTLVVNKNLHFQQVSDILGISIDDIRQYNPQFKTDIIPGLNKPYTINLPLSKATAFIANQDTIYNHRATELLTHRKIAGADVVSAGNTSRATTRMHKVKRGDTLGNIASRYGVSVNQLKQWNGLRSTNINVGRSLRVSNPYLVAKKTETEIENKPIIAKEQTTTLSPDGTMQIIKSQRAETKNTYHKIKRGETLASIAKKYNVSTTDLKTWNKLSSNNLIAGKNLVIKKIHYTEVIDTVRVVEPELSVLEIDREYLSSIVDEYIDKNEINSVSSFPRITLDGSEQTENEVRIQEINDRTVYHKVRIGETLTKIAAQYHVTQESIIAWNKLSSPIAKAGQRLVIYLPRNK